MTQFFSFCIEIVRGVILCPTDEDSQKTEPPSKPNRADLDFKPYLEIVSKDAERARSTLYVLLTITAVLFTCVAPWLLPNKEDMTLPTLFTAEVCINNNNSIPGTIIKCDECVSTAYKKCIALSSGDDTKIVTSLSPKDVTTSTAAKQVLKQYIAKKIEQLEQSNTNDLSVNIPVLGIKVYECNLGIVAGSALVFLMYLLHVSLTRLCSNITTATKCAGGKENLELMQMAIVLAIPSKKGGGVNKVLTPLMFVPLMVYVLVVLKPVFPFTSLTHLDAFTTLVRAFKDCTPAATELRLDIVCAVLLLWLSCRVAFYLKYLGTKLNDIHKKCIEPEVVSPQTNGNSKI